MTKPTYKIFYLKDEHGHKVACVASKLVGGIQVQFAVSTHNPIDKFNRDVARQVAIGRLEKAETIGVVGVGKDVKKRVLELIAGEPFFPERTRRAAQRWLDIPQSKPVGA